MIDELLIPLAGSYTNAAAIQSRGSRAVYQTTSILSLTYLYYMAIGPSNISMGSAGRRTQARAIRCFKNAPDPTITSLSYLPSPSTRTSGNVVVTVTLDQTGAMLTGWTLSGMTFTKTYTTNWSGEVSFPSAQGGSISTGISVTNIDTTPPVITLSGASTVTLYQGGTYTELGAQWTDNVDGTNTLPAPTSGSVNVNLVGTYLLTYSYTDSAGNISNIVTRTVSVQAIPVVTPPSTSG